jgi:hypothetical protein
MFHLIKSIHLKETPRGFSIVDIRTNGDSLIQRSKNKFKSMEELKSYEPLKVRGKENQFLAYSELEKFGIQLNFPTKYQRRLKLSKLLSNSQIHPSF